MLSRRVAVRSHAQVARGSGLVLVLLATACSSPHRGVWHELRPADLVAIGADQAHLDDDGVLLRIQARYDHGVPDQVVHGYAPFQEDEDGAAEVSADPLCQAWVRTLTADDWSRRSASRPELPILSAVHWSHIQRATLGALLPGRPDEAVLLQLGRYETWLLCRNESGEAVLLAPEERPAGLRLTAHLSPAEVHATARRNIAAVLTEQGIADRRVLFNTGVTDPAGFQTVFVDLDRPLACLQRLAAPGGSGDRDLARAGQTGKLLVVEGTAIEIATRPVSNLYRLLFAAKHGLTDLLKPTDSRRLLLLGDEVPPVETDVGGMDIEAFEERLDDITGTSRQLGTVRLLVDGSAYFPRLFEALVNAESSVDMRMFIFKTDEYAVRVADVLRRRADDGLDVRVLLDGVGTTMGVVDRDPSMPPGFTPPLSIEDYLEDDSDVDVRVRTRALLAADHSKITVVDGQLAFLGGMNIGREYRFDWHDLMAEVRGPVVAEMLDQFELAWAHAGWAGDLGYAVHRLVPGGSEPPEAPPGSHPIRVLRTRTDASEIYRAQVAALRAARSRIIVENAYLADDEILTELVAARLRGVDVRVILPVQGNHAVMNASNLVTTNVLHEHGVRVYLYPGMTHVKAAIYDGWACIGSANFDRLSLRRNQELNIAFSDPEAVERLYEQVLRPDLEASLEVTERLDTSWSDHLQGFLAGAL